MNKLEKINKMLELMQNDTITPKQIEEFLKVVLNVIKVAKDNFDSISSENLIQIQKALNYITTEHEKIMSSVTHETKNAKQDMSKELMQSVADMKKMCEDLMLSKPLDGKDADETKIVQDVLSQLPKVEEETPEQTRDKLETLTGEERLDASAIKNLPQILDKNNETLAKGRLVSVAVDGTTITGDGTLANPLVSIATGTGNVVGPVTHAASYIPQWNATPNSKTLVEGLAVPAGGLAGITALNLKADTTALASYIKLDGSNMPFTGGVVLATGTTVLAPLKFIAGTNLTTPVAGVIEFDGIDFWVTI